MFRKSKLTILFAMLCAGVSLVACKKNDDDGNSTGNATLNMRLTDAPGEYDAVNLDIQKIEVTMAGSSAVSLTPARPGVYDILRFRNGLDTLLAQTTIPAGTVNQIRLVLGSNNSVVVDGQTHALNTPSAQESGLKLNLNTKLEQDKAYTFWIDFDAAKSINQTGNGKYQLKPVIRAYSELTDGRIKGYVLPAASLTTVYAINGTDTFSAIPAANGYFMMRGLPEGNYTVIYDAGLITFKDMTKTNIAVKFGAEVDLGTTTLVQ
jgi:hypothetical protein